MRRWILLAVLVSALSLGFSLYVLGRTLCLQGHVGAVGARVMSTQFSIEQYFHPSGKP